MGRVGRLSVSLALAVCAMLFVEICGAQSLPTLGGTQFWADELFFHQWHIQRNALTGHYRLLDENSWQCASGTYEECLAKLEEIKREQELVPMSGTVVLVVHGLGRTRYSMRPLADYLKEHTHWTVLCVGYPSTRAAVDDHARSLMRVVENLDGIKKVHFVAHSLGNIVIRRFMSLAAERKADEPALPAFGRMVMLGPPNQGAAMATTLGEEFLVRNIVGKPVEELGKHWPWLESSLATPPCEFGIIAGGRGDDEGYNPLLEGDDDGVVSVESTRLDGAKEMIVVPVLHTVLPNDETVQQYTLRFLRSGRFQRQADGE
jgi:pimeloyl-ACP methyl ester carboxylesterase